MQTLMTCQQTDLHIMIIEIIIIIIIIITTITIK